MIYLGLAKLVEATHPTGIRVKSWDLTPWGGPEVFLGAITQPMPPIGTTVDRGGLRLDTNRGRVWKLEEGDPGPRFGTPGLLGAVNMQTLAMFAVGAYVLSGMMGVRRATRRRRR